MRSARWLALLTLGCLAACAHTPPAPLIQPTVEVQSFVPVQLTPDALQLQAVLQLTNNMDDEVQFDRIDYATELFDAPVVRSQYGGFKETRAHHSRTITLPLAIPIEQVIAQANQLGAEKKLRVAFHGTLFTEDPVLQPVTFSQSLEVGVPKLPTVSYLGSEGVPLGPDFRVRLAIQNPNTFPIDVTDVTTSLRLNGEDYRLVHTVDPQPIAPGQREIVTLQMKNSPSKMFSMVVNVVSAQAAHFTLSGSFTFGTPFVQVYLPVSVSDR